MATLPKDLEKLAAEFHETGAIVIDGLFSSDDCTGVTQLLDRYLVEEPKKSISNRNEYGARFETELKVWQASNELAPKAIYLSAELRAVTAAILGPDFAHRGAISFSTGEGSGLAWHQDTASDDADQFVLNRILSCHDVDEEQGALYYVPGTHKLGDLSPGPNHGSIEGEVAIYPSVGTMVLLHSRCWHRVGLNQTDRPRIQMNDLAWPKNARPDLANFAVFRGDTWNHAEGKPWR